MAAIPVTGTELEEVSTQVVVRLDPQARLLETGGKNCKKYINQKYVLLVPFSTSLCIKVFRLPCIYSYTYTNKHLRC